MDRDLADLVGCRAEAVEPEACRVAGHTQGAVADQAAAEQRSELLVGEFVGKGEAEALVGDGQLRVTAVDVATGELRVDAEVLATGLAVVAGAVGVAEPR